MDRTDIPRFLLYVGVVSVVVFAGLYLVMIETPFTGFLTFDKNVSLSIEAEQAGEISHFSFDQIITIGNSTFVDLELMNTGSVPISGSYKVEIYDINNTLQHTYPGPTRTLQPGAFMSRTVKHTPHDTGTYIIRLRAEMGGDVLQTARFLLVRKEPVPQDPDPIFITKKRVRYVYGPEPEVPEPPSRSWRVEAPRNIELGQGAATTLPIRITNTGEATLRNVRLALRSSRNLTVEYEPKIMFGIPADVTRNFLLTITSDGTRHDQNITYRVVSEKMEQGGETNIDIVPTTTIAQLEKDAENIRLLISDAENDLQALEEDGLTVEEARTLLDEAASLLNKAETSIENEEISAARKQLDDSRERVGEAFQKLFKARSEQLIVTAPLVQPVYLLILGSILIAVLLVGTYYYIQEKHEDRPKLLRDLDEEKV